MEHIKIPPPLSKMRTLLAEKGFASYLVGGAVRDTLRGKPMSDWDVATNARPEDVCAIFRRVIPTGIEHGTVTVLFMGHKIEVTTFRTEADYSDGRHPDSVSYTASIEEDLSRRDFTINAIAASLADGKITDPFGGRADIKQKILRTVGDPRDRFVEDGLRPVRAIRFAATLGFAIDSKTQEAIPGALEKTRLVSIERFRDEFVKMLGADEPSVALKLMEQTGILPLFLPELCVCRGVDQKDYRNHHQFDVLDHLFYACDGAPKDNLTVRLAALFHDIGKPLVKETIQKPDASGISHSICTFYNHEQKSAELCKRIMTRLRFPNQLIVGASHLVAEHMFHYEPSWSDSAIRRFVVRVTPEAIPDLFDLRIADAYGMTCARPPIDRGGWAENLLEFKERIDAVLAEKTALSLKDLAVSGSDLLAIGIPPGKAIGLVLHELLETVLDNPAENEREHLLQIAKNRATLLGAL
jgi:putative nucleotidyltransferase with HDIG domain